MVLFYYTKILWILHLVGHVGKLQKKKEIPEGISLAYTTHTKYWIFVVDADRSVALFVTVMTEPVV